MLRLPPFEYYMPQNISEAVSLIAKFGEDAMYSAGGTDLYPNMKRKQCSPNILIGLNELEELSFINLDDDGIYLGSGISLNEVANHQEVKKLYPALSKAASLVPCSNNNFVHANPMPLAAPVTKAVFAINFFLSIFRLK